ncbi:MAG TPA: hypothetical protein DF292_01560 [Firmicutes bacterium]|nr:hypothetical protein [Bacillota bacterium]
MLGDRLKNIIYHYKRSIGSVLGVVVLLSVIVFCSASQDVRAYETPAGYDEHNYQKLVAFLELPNGAGKNGDKISASYDPGDPTTWAGVQWDNGADKRVSMINWSKKGLVGSLDVSGCTALFYFFCVNNQITELNVSGCTDLNFLCCSNEQITELNVSGCTALMDLWCDFNPLTSMDVSGCTALENLLCGSNLLTALDVSGCLSLKRIQCDFNELTALDVSGCTALEELECYYNELTSLDVSGCTALKELECFSNKLTVLDVSICSALKNLYCYYNQMTELNARGCTALEELKCNSNKLTKLDVSSCTALKDLYCDSNELTELKVSGCAALEELMCNSNKLTALDVSGCSALKSLYCYSNQLTSLNTSGCTALLTLGCGSNQLASIDVSGLTALLTLGCSSNPLNSLDVGGHVTLTILTCEYSQLTELKVSGCTALENLKCSSNRLTSLDVSGCTALVDLVCGYNPLAVLDVNGCTALVDLDCRFSKLTALDVSGCTALERLDCYVSELIALNVSGCTSLDYLCCSFNRLTFSTLPLFNGTYYWYSRQSELQIGSGGKVVIGNEIDLSAEAVVNGVDTVFTWYRNDGLEIEPTTSVNGTFTFDHGFGKRTIYCQMTNTTFPELTLETTEILLIGPEKPKISAQPQSIIVGSGTTATFSVTATATDTNLGGILSYQWQQSTDGGSSWSEIVDAVENCYTTAAVTSADNGYQYRCAVTNTKDEITAIVLSDAAMLSVVASPIITSQPQDTTIPEGAAATFSITAELPDDEASGVLSYQWQQSTDGGSNWGNADGATTNSYTTPAATFASNGHQYRCQVINTREGVSATFFSNSVALSVVAGPTITNQPQNITILKGTTAIFSVTAETADGGIGGVLSYQWQLSTDGGSVWSNVDGATTHSYTTALVTITSNGYQYRCKVTNTRNEVSAEVFSAVATLAVQTHFVTFIKPTAANDENNPVNINSGSLVLAKILGEIADVETVTIQIDDGAEQAITPSGNTIYYLLPADLSEGWHTLTIKLTNTVDYQIEATVTFYWDNYRRGFGFGRFDFGEADDH